MTVLLLGCAAAACHTWLCHVCGKTLLKWQYGKCLRPCFPLRQWLAACCNTYLSYISQSLCDDIWQACDKSLSWDKLLVECLRVQQAAWAVFLHQGFFSNVGYKQTYLTNSLSILGWHVGTHIYTHVYLDVWTMNLVAANKNHDNIGFFTCTCNQYICV